MSDLLAKVISDQDAFKKILGKIPGFKGYIERQSRRDADKLLRETIAREFDAQWQRISTLQKEMLSQGDLAHVDDMEEAAIKLRTFIDRVRNASYGHSSLFDAVKINEPELARLYQFDAALLGMADEINSAMDNVEVAIGTEGLPAAIRNLVNLAAKCVDTFNRRRDVIVQATPSGSSDQPAQ
jgi:hypothetical protein